MGRLFIILSMLVPAVMITSGPGHAETVEQEESTLTPEQERLQRQKRVLEAMQKERRNKQEAKEQAEKERQQTMANCKDAQQELSRRQSAAYLYRKNKDGEREVFSDAERAKSTTEAEAAVKKWCK